VESVLDGLAARVEPLVVRLDRQPGQKEARYAETLVEHAAPPAPGPAPAEVDDDRLAALEREVAALRTEVAALRAEVDRLSG
jgi:uncharacterized protein YceH (UPF0502 family)